MVAEHHDTLPGGRRCQLGEPRELAGGEGLLALWRTGSEILGEAGQTQRILGTQDKEHSSSVGLSSRSVASLLEWTS